MDFPPWAISLLQSLGFSIAGAWAAVKILFEHRLNKAIEAQKSKYAEDLATLEGKIREEVDSRLGEEAALREYKFDARKRLYLAVGPLRFQLLLACRDLAGRISTHGRRMIYQAVCFPVYGIPKVRRRDYFVFDRAHLAYLNALEKLNCAYCIVCERASSPMSGRWPHAPRNIGAASNTPGAPWERTRAMLALRISATPKLIAASLSGTGHR